MTIRLPAIVPMLVVSLAGCTILAPQPDPSRFFVLGSTDSAVATAAGGLRLGLGPIRFPAYLQRQQLIVRLGPNEVRLSENDRWGEPLETGFARVLAENLRRDAAARQVLPYPWYSSQEPDRAINVDVIQFDVAESGEARLLARWQITTPGGDEVLHVGLTDTRGTASDDSPDAAVEALGRAVAELSAEIAAGLLSLKK